MKSLFSTLSIFAFALSAAPALSAPAGTKIPKVPDYVKKYAPLIYLHSDEQYFPQEVGTFLHQTKPLLKFEPVAINETLSLNNLGKELNQYGDVYLATGKDNVLKDIKPEFMYGIYPTDEGKSATMPVIVVDKGNGMVDAFYFTFYAYNGPTQVLNMVFDNHVGDWENCMIRFQDGVPQAAWLAQHAFGQAFAYKALEKVGVRPVVYSAKGSHAIYAVEGGHDHMISGEFHLPFGLVVDHTDRGPLWDPLLKSAYYFYDVNTKTFSASGDNPGIATDWLDYRGSWGDEALPDSDPNQVTHFGNEKYGGGPGGPIFKTLDRETLCDSVSLPLLKLQGMCIILPVAIIKREEGGTYIDPEQEF